MSNRLHIDTQEIIDFKSREASFAIHIYDDYGETTIFVSKEQIDCDDMEVLKNVIKAKHRCDIHGGSCDFISDFLDFARENAKGITIANTFYDYVELQDFLDYDIRKVYFCPECGWESFDDSEYEADCGQSDCNGVITEIKEEWYEV